MSEDLEFLSPVGRIVTGDPYRGRDKDTEGNPLVIKHGANAGQPRVEFSIGLAVPKRGEVHWNQTEWGLKLWNKGVESHPTCFGSDRGMVREVAFKVADGDSQVPNTKNKRNCDREGFPGHWIIFFSNGSAPRCYNSTGTEPLADGVIKRGHWAQVHCYVKSNENNQKPGMYMNMSMIAHAGFDTEISTGADASQVGFGQESAPAHVSQTPVGGMGTPPPAGAGAPPPAQQQTAPPAQQQYTPPPGAGAPPAQQQYTPPPGAGAPPAQQTAPPPAHDLVQPGAGAGTPPPPPGAGAGAPPAAPEPSYMVNGAVHTRSAILAWEGWTEAHLAGLTPA